MIQGHEVEDVLALVVRRAAPVPAVALHRHGQGVEVLTRHCSG